MSLGVRQNTQKIYLNLKEGRIVKRTQGQEEFYDFVEGHLVGISKRDRDFKGEAVPYWYIDLQEPIGSQIYSLCLHYSSGVAKSIINCLASVEEPGLVKIETYQSGDFTKAVVYSNGQRLSWKQSELPPLEEVKVGGRTLKDDSKRMELIEELARETASRITRPII